MSFLGFNLTVIIHSGTEGPFICHLRCLTAKQQLVSGRPAVSPSDDLFFCLLSPPFIYQWVAVVGELQEVKDLIAWLKGDNECPRLRLVPASCPPLLLCPLLLSSTASAPLLCPRIGIVPYSEGVIGVASDQALYLFDHLEGGNLMHPVACQTPRCLCMSHLWSMLLTVPSGLPTLVHNLLYYK